MDAIPSVAQCRELWERAHVPPHIREHSRKVALVAQAPASHLNLNSLRVNVDLVRAGALLHDIAKGLSLKTGENHAQLGYALLWRWGWHQVAPIVRDHILMDPERAQGPITESLLVNYADKRVKHDQIVGLEERFEDLILRYGKTPAIRDDLRRRLDLYRIVEARIFSHLPWNPEDVERFTDLRVPKGLSSAASGPMPGGADPIPIRPES
ncbi:HDIG domain-containing protein [Desulfacinum hydrothermale DSM 13146]|uniref:HDIG domain-containing protein n=1 Tax=Desulfacinum hydrothermale DSM 13146 TaxID=1121390 RepID=A0A1W1XMJ3_9BACT|nr:HD domain-containing protein [Desulfacinum hydrothermale]SMC25210.1 HDIG domain-containing protein [Desulfacinum hydrothermale DSM 13146]